MKEKINPERKDESARELVKWDYTFEEGKWHDWKKNIWVVGKKYEGLSYYFLHLLLAVGCKLKRLLAVCEVRGMAVPYNYWLYKHKLKD